MTIRQASTESAPTLKQIRSWIEERELEKKKAAVIGARIAVLDAQLVWARMFLSEETRAEIFGGTSIEEEINSLQARKVKDEIRPEIVRPTRFSRIKWMNKLMLDAEQGLTDSEIWQKVRVQNPVNGAEETARTIKSLVENMCRRGRLRRRGEFIYHPATLVGIERGELQERAEAKRPKRGSTKALILKVLSMTGDAPAKVVLAKLWKMPEAKPLMQQSPSYPYAMLSRMALAGEIDRKNGKYCLPRD